VHHVDVGSTRIEIVEIVDSGDFRGSSFPAPASWFDPPFPVHDVHVSTLLPTCVRGDHYHVRRNEILVILAGTSWSLFCDDGPGTARRQQSFDGKAVVMVSVPPLMSHAIRNDGDEILHIIGLTDGPYDPNAPDAFTRKVSSS
jgi:dTDP-4-dehydrorhamnose 3,5-epimerase-like enzyme